MKLDKEQHRRGILSWDTDGPVAFSTATTDSPTNPPKWSDDLTDHGGTVVESPSRSLNMLRCLPKDPATMSSPFEVRWERIGDNSVITQVWNDDISSGSSGPAKDGRINKTETSSGLWNISQACHRDAIPRLERGHISPCWWSNAPFGHRRTLR